MNADTASVTQLLLWPPTGRTSLQLEPAFIPVAGPFALKSGIYGIKNLINGKWYIGQSKNIFARRHKHFYTLKHNLHQNDHLQSSFNKYGESAFEFHIIEEVDESMIDAREKTWILHYNSIDPAYGYNEESGGSFGKHYSEERRKKLSEARRKQGPFSKERCQNMSVGIKAAWTDERRKILSEKMRGNKYTTGTTLSEERRKNLSKKLTGKIRTIEHRIHLSQALTGRHHSEATKCKISEIQKGKKLSYEQKIKIGLAHSGSKRSVETREKQSEARKRYWAKRKRLEAK